jgi:hypothetical protein
VSIHEKHINLQNAYYVMKGKNKRHKKKQEQEWRTEAIDNIDIVDISENKPSDYWAIMEAREEYCKELYDTPDC